VGGHELYEETGMSTVFLVTILPEWLATGDDTDTQ
jgi:uncharacterized membrane protein